jgi:pimeloyl-ACP methyl ester carboxylesterase
MERCIQIMTHYDFTEKLKGLPENSILVLQGDSDQGMPYEAGVKVIEGLVPSARVSMYEKAGHGLYLTHAEKVVEDIIGFVKGVGSDRKQPRL